MSATHPYISGPGNIAQMVNHLRKNFPSNVTSDTVKRLSIAPNNESYVINALQFIGVLNEEGNKTDAAAKIFSIHKDEDFHSAFSELIKSSYDALFDLHGEEAWTLEKDELIGFFRQADQTSATIGARQAGTYLVFKALSGHGDLPAVRKVAAKKTDSSSSAQNKISSGAKSKPKAARKESSVTLTDDKKSKGEVAITVRVEINLPGDGTKETYDNIFKSIRENLMDE